MYESGSNLPTDDEVADMYEYTQQYLENHGIV
jgi:coproporphyrinogen III oxidase-like Fe-S oxidoreductase